MNSIIWKNKSSSEIPGLLICELPPISVPKIRRSIIEIEGRDGDIVENLGYESYTKNLSVALTKNYDVNEVINFFTGEGKLILSNEPDKYYNAQIIDSIDFNRLINFKTAKVKFYVQPYKFKLNEEKFTGTNELTVTNAGYIDSLPKITIVGSGNIDFKLNNTTIFSLELGTETETIVIDSTLEEAYGIDGVLKNNKMIGDFPKLTSGNNTIILTGTVTSVVIEPNSRWL